ncbi:MAG: class D sortase [Candidatus Acidiferrales bacterium]
MVTKGRNELSSCVSFMGRSTIIKTLSGFERLLVLSGLLLIFAYLAVGIYSAVYSRAAIRAFWRNQAVTSSQPGNSLQPNSGIPDFRLWSPQRIRAYQASLTANVPSPLGDLRIPSVRIEVPVLEGTDDLTLNRGVGHIEGTPLPGEGGNIGVAGHRDGFFRGLKDVRLGDPVDLYAQNGNTRYVVDEILIVPPEDVSVLWPRLNRSITLVTCYPFYFVGSAPLRYIVHASTEDPINLNASGQQSLLNGKRGPEN